jgi:ATP-dependent Lon protease
MLRADVVAAVKDGRFHVYPVKTIDEGIEILTGIEAGAAGPDGEYPEGTVHGLVDQELQRLAKGLKAFNAPAEKGDGPSEGSK